MRPTKVILTPTSGDLPEKVIVFEEPTQCTIGRAPDCDIQVPMDLAHADVSRHHCLLEIDPPKARVRDLGSRNGTYINGAKIGQRPPGQEAGEADRCELPEWDLHDGDEILVGHTGFRVRIAEVEEAPVPLYFL